MKKFISIILAVVIAFAALSSLALTIPELPAGRTTAQVRLYKTTSTRKGYLTSLKSGTEFVIVAQSPSFYRVVIGKRAGYVLKKYVKVVETSGMQTQATSTEKTQTFEEQVIALTNEKRAENGLSPLKNSAELMRIARLKSQDMSDKKYFSHTSPTYGDTFKMMKDFNISFTSAGENIAMGHKTPEAVVNAWMNSPGHRANILSNKFTQIGVGYVADGNYWTQMFIG